MITLRHILFNCSYSVYPLTSIMYAYVCAMQELYAEDPRVWNAIFEIVVADLRKCETEGIPLGGDQGRIFPIILNTKGDWSYLDTWF